MGGADGMLTGFPSGKITPPLPGALVHRARLLSSLTAAVDQGKIVLVVAPGGAGKTALLADWAHAVPWPVAWYALDAGDRDTRRLVAGLLAAIERVLPGRTAETGELLAQGASAVAILGMLLGALENMRLTLVLDDFQRIDEAPHALALWEQFFRFRPPSLTLVLLSRSVPLLGFASLAAMDALAGLGQRDLGFDRQEAAALLAAHDLPTDDAAHLASRSGGWATGILLLARAGNTGMLQLRAHQETLVEQFGFELLAGLPAALRQFLLESAVLGPVTPTEANQLLDRTDSRLRFAEAAARGLFVEQVDNYYRYHDLMAEFLQRVLTAEDPARVQQLRARAAEHWLQQGDYGRALALMAAQAEWPLLRSMLEQIGMRLWESGLWGTIVEYVGVLPVTEQSLRLLELAGFAHAELGEYGQALEIADRAAALAAGDEEFLRAALLSVQTLVLAGRGAEAVQRAEAALSVAQRIQHQRAIARLRQWRGRVLFHAGQVEEGRADLMAALSVYEQRGDTRGAALVCSQLASHLAETGQVAEATKLVARASALWLPLGSSIALAGLDIDRARLHALQGNLSGATDALGRAARYLAREPHAHTDLQVRTVRAEIALDAYDLREAEEVARGALEDAVRLDTVPMVHAALRICIDVALARRDRAGARKLLDEARSIPSTEVDGAHLDLREGGLALRSRALERAIDALETAARTLEQLHRPQWAARAYLLLAEAYWSSGARGRAETGLNRAALLAAGAQCEGFLHPTARFCRHVLGDQHLLRRLHTRTRDMARLLAGTVPTLRMVKVETEPSQPAGGLLHLSPFGQGALVLNGREIPPTALPAKARELLFFTAHQGRAVTRAELLCALWDDEEHAEQNLWDASRNLRRVLSAQSWHVRHGVYTLTARVDYDLTQFRSLAATVAADAPLVTRLAAAEEARRLAGDGSFLEWCASLWAASLRSQVEREILDLLMTAAGLYHQLSRFEEEQQAYRQAIALDEFDERARLALVHFLGQVGAVEAALQEYTTYSRLLREELGAKPSRALLGLVRRLQAER